MRNDDDGPWPLVFAALVILVVAVALGYRWGLNHGAIDHSCGKVIVTQLPDGTYAVTKPKPQ